MKKVLCVVDKFGYFNLWDRIVCFFGFGKDDPAKDEVYEVEEEYENGYYKLKGFYWTYHKDNFVEISSRSNQ